MSIIQQENRFCCDKKICILISGSNRFEGDVIIIKIKDDILKY